MTQPMRRRPLANIIERPWLVSAPDGLQARMSIVHEIGRGLIRDGSGCAWNVVTGDYGDVWAVSRHWDAESANAYVRGDFDLPAPTESSR